MKLITDLTQLKQNQVVCQFLDVNKNPISNSDSNFNTNNPMYWKIEKGEFDNLILHFCDPNGTSSETVIRAQDFVLISSGKMSKNKQDMLDGTWFYME